MPLIDNKVLTLTGLPPIIMLPYSAGNCLLNGKYCYMSDLVALNDNISLNPLKPIPELQTIEPPLKLKHGERR